MSITPDELAKVLEDEGFSLERADDDVCLYVRGSTAISVHYGPSQVDSKYLDNVLKDLGLTEDQFKEKLTHEQ